jgi:hypothetical protein
MSQSSQVLDRPNQVDLPSVRANLTYILPPTEKPVNYTFEPPPGVPQRSGIPDVHTVPIYDARTIAPTLYSPLLRNGLLDLRLHQRYNDVIHFTRAGGLLV